MHGQAMAVKKRKNCMSNALQVIHLDVKSKVSSPWQPLEQLHECKEA